MSLYESKKELKELKIKKKLNKDSKSFTKEIRNLKKIIRGKSERKQSE